MTSRAAYMRGYRARRKAAGGVRLTIPKEETRQKLKNPRPPKCPATALARWSKRRLKIPPGHANAGKPLELPAYALDFLREALQPGIREAGCFVARKNAKSAAIAVLILAYLAPDGPLRRAGWRAGVASISREKALELWQQCEDITLASNLGGVTFRRAPRRIVSDWGTADFLSADKSAGHASGFDLAIFDEMGLSPERGRALAAGLLSSTSTRDGRLVAISVIGDSPLSRELMDRAADPSVVVHVHQADPDAALDDESAWRAANPTLGTVKSLDYMRDMARRALDNPSEQGAFRAFDLNQPASPDRQPIVTLDAFRAVCGYEQPARAGPVYVGLDLGGSVSLTAAALYWPESARLETYAAAGAVPTLAARGEADGCGAAYVQMEARGELRTFGGRVTPVPEFLDWIASMLAGERPAAAIADRYRQAEAEDAMQRAGLYWPMQWRGSGAGPDGFADVRGFQKAVYETRLRPGLNLALSLAVENSAIEPDRNGNPVLLKGRQNGRIDPLSAAVLAVGVGDREAGKPVRPSAHIPLAA